MRRLKLKHGYHDALVTAVRYPDDSDVVLDVILCGCCNPTPGIPSTLWFIGVRNAAEVRRALEAARELNASKPYVAEIVGIVRGDDARFLVDLGEAGSVRIDAKGLHES